MTNSDSNAVPKVHPATRPAEPEDPMNLHGHEVPGDPDLMLRVLVEEFARMGFGLEAIIDLSRDPFYQSFYGLRQMLGEEGLRDRVGEILSRCGVMKATIREAAPPPGEDELVQLDLSQRSGGQ